MAELTGALIAHRRRLGEVARILARNGLAAWVPRGSGLIDAGTWEKLREQAVGPEVTELSEGERLRNALSELGTTWVKFSQMLSLRPDVVGADVAAELEQLQGAVPPIHPASRNGPSSRNWARASPTSMGASRRSRSLRGRSPRSTGRRSTTARPWPSRSCTTVPPSG